MSFTVTNTTLRCLNYAATRKPSYQRRTSAVVVAYTSWKLKPDTQWCKQHVNKAKDVTPIDLTALLKHTNECHLGTHVDEGDDDVLLNAPYEVDLVISDVGADASDPGAKHAVTGLVMKNLGSQCDIAVDEHLLPVGNHTRLHPGAKISIGDDYGFILERNVHARA